MYSYGMHCTLTPQSAMSYNSTVWVVSLFFLCILSPFLMKEVQNKGKSYLFSFIVGNPSYFILTVSFFAKYAIHVPISWSCIRTAQFVFFFTLASCSGEKSSLLRTCSSCACALHSLWILFEFSFPVKSRLCLGSALLARQWDLHPWQSQGRAQD